MTSHRRGFTILPARILAGAVLCVAIGCVRPSVPDREIAAETPVVGRSEADSLLWQNPKVTRFLLETLGDSQTVDYASFELESVSAVTYLEWTWPRPPSENPGIWDFASDSSMAASSRGYEGQPDNILAVFNRKGNGKVEKIRDCGTPCQYLGIQWVDDDRFVFLMTTEYYSGDSMEHVDGYFANVVLYDLAVDSAFTYKSSPVLKPGGR